LRGHTETIGARLQRDLAEMRPLPAAPFEACAQANGRVNSQSLVRYATNDYSVPVAYGHQDVWVRAYVDQVVIGCRGDVIARHPRCYGREDMVLEGKARLNAAREALHYLCAPVPPPREVEQFLRYFCGDAADPNALTETEALRTGN